MKTIEPVSVWTNGQKVNATVLNAYASNVNLNTSATFEYLLFSQFQDGNINSQVAQGYLVMTGDDYEQWEIDSYAWDWVAEQLNLTITGDYVPPVPPQPEPTPEPEPETEVEETTEPETEG